MSHTGPSGPLATAFRRVSWLIAVRTPNGTNLPLLAMAKADWDFTASNLVSYLGMSPALQSDAFYTNAFCRRPQGGRQIQKHGRRQSFVPSTRTDMCHGSTIRSSHSMIQKNTIPIIDSRTIAANWRAMLRSAFAIIMT